MPKDIKSIDDLTPDPRNANKGTERGYRVLDDSIRDLGAGRSIVTDKEGRVIAGNKTLEAAVEAGLAIRTVQTDGNELVVVQRTDLDLEDGDDTARRLAYADNRTGELGLEWDAAMIADDMEAGFDFSGLFEDFELNELMDAMNDPDGDMPEDPGPQIDKAAELQEVWETERGQVWEIPSVATEGKAHRLMCGDNSEKQDISKLFADERCGLVFTSPPYGQQREYTGASNISDWGSMMRGAFSCIPATDDVQILVNLGLIHRDCEWVPYWDHWIDWMRSEGWRRFGWYVWDQLEGLPGDWNGRLAPSHEFVFHFNKESLRAVKWVEKKEASIRVATGTGMRRKDGSMQGGMSSPEASLQTHKIHDSVLRETRQKGGIEGHPAPFSTRLASSVIRNWPGLVYDPFLGSGTTMVATEQTTRLCYAMEIEPKYVAVALQRMADMELEPRLTT